MEIQWLIVMSYDALRANWSTSQSATRLWTLSPCPKGPIAQAWLSGLHCKIANHLTPQQTPAWLNLITRSPAMQIECKGAQDREDEICRLAVSAALFLAEVEVISCDKPIAFWTSSVDVSSWGKPVGNWTPYFEEKFVGIRAVLKQMDWAYWDKLMPFYSIEKKKYADYPFWLN